MQVYAPLAKELFSVAFLSCWLHLFDPYQDFLAKSLEQALRSPNLPPDVMQALLNLAEFIDVEQGDHMGGQSLPLDYSLLGELAEKGHAYAKALYYKEVEFRTAPGRQAGSSQSSELFWR
jgi:serine/threonine-protein kinase mTOR